MSDKHAKGPRKVRRVIRLVTLGLAVAAVVKEIRTPADEREWHGVVVGFVPYDFRVPTVARVKERMWDPDSAHLVNPRVFGVGWTVNVGRMISGARRRIAA
ncbi:hypothetical protein IC607_13495 [Cellulomonas sp. JH27-2]|uniref:DUF5808 domain-containing protein n=1 Tax=Cellulomonas sp. JH27-2 TaxID=2774139 RepID=UPI001783707C|nr:DUF5808 domain-containing protein [Cellulomonas sp. JH27-2]MBD8059983.1 hypothetical protein [Cellulomonas sp. JH27-2]